MDGERLVGIVSYVDLLGYLRREEPAAAPARAVGGAAARRRRPRRSDVASLGEDAAPGGDA